VLQVAITDTGIGISEKNLRNLFQMFSQADQSVSQRYGGSGLGLYLTKQLIQFMGGKLSVDSVEGKGTTHTLNIAYRY
jgi:signal transduction histidine kinase